MVECFNGNAIGVEFFFLIDVKNICKPAVMVQVVVRRDHRIQLDCRPAIVLRELPINEVGGVLARVLFFSRIAAIYHDVSEIGCLDQHTIALTNINEIDF